jgi:hypothetical protein
VNGNIYLSAADTALIRSIASLCVVSYAAHHERSEKGWRAEGDT